MCGLVLSGAFLHNTSFLWPLLGSDFPHDSLIPPFTILVLLDAAASRSACGRGDGSASATLRSAASSSGGAGCTEPVT